ncbi:MAG: VOC family protein [Pseudomonadota bacterium]
MSTDTTSPVNGLHHVTAIASDPQANLDFWSRNVGLRFIKKTVNFDDPGTYHLYYGDELGHAGTVLTYFPWSHMRRGRPGAGEVALTQFAVPEGSLQFWTERLANHGASQATTPFGENIIVAEDPDGLPFALIETPADPRGGWVGNGVDADHAVHGFRGVTLRLADLSPTADLMTHAMGYRVAQTGPGVIRLETTGDSAAGIVDLVQADDATPPGLGAGSVHHVAFSVSDDDAHAIARKRILETGTAVTPVIDRDYFHAIYFREPGGTLFEIATENPGFTRDEAAEALGTGLKLPSQHEHLRAQLKQSLPKLVA